MIKNLNNNIKNFINEIKYKSLSELDITNRYHIIKDLMVKLEERIRDYPQLDDDFLQLKSNFEILNDLYNDNRDLLIDNIEYKYVSDLYRDLISESKLYRWSNNYWIIKKFNSNNQIEYKNDSEVMARLDLLQKIYVNKFGEYMYVIPYYGDQLLLESDNVDHLKLYSDLISYLKFIHEKGIIHKNININSIFYQSYSPGDLSGLAGDVPQGITPLKYNGKYVIKNFYYASEG